MLYESRRQQVYIFNGRGQSATVTNEKAAKALATTPLGGKPEFAVADSSGRVYNNIEDQNEVAVIEAQPHAVVARDAGHASADAPESPRALELGISTGRWQTPARMTP
jgi:hypothetical protein